MLADLDWQRLGAELAGLDPPLGLAVHVPAEPSALARELTGIARAIESGSSGGARCAPGDDSGVPALPALTLGLAGRATLHYLALPEGREREPFVAAVRALAQLARSPASSADDELAARLAPLTGPATLLVFVAPF